MDTSSEMDLIIGRICEQTTKSEYVDAMVLHSKMTIRDDSIVHEVESRDNGSYIHRESSETIVFPKRILEELVTIAIPVRHSVMKTTVRRHWREQREDKYVTIGEDYDKSGEEDIEVSLELTLSVDGPKFSLHRV